MEKQTLHIGQRIKQIAARKNMPVRVLTSKIGRERSFVYYTFGRETMSIKDIDQWAKILEVEAVEITGEIPNEVQTGTSRGSDYLMKYVSELEERVKEQAQTIRVLLGKSEVYPAYAGL